MPVFPIQNLFLFVGGWLHLAIDEIVEGFDSLGDIWSCLLLLFSHVAQCSAEILVHLSLALVLKYLL